MVRFPSLPSLAPRRWPSTAAALLALLVLVAPTGRTHGAEAPTYRLDDRAAPLSQEIRLRLDPARDDYTGTTRIDVRVSRPVDALMFHAEDLELERAVLRGAGSEDGSERTWPLETEIGTWGTVTARAGETLAPGDYILEIGFRREYNTRTVGLFRVEQEGKHYLFTQFEVDHAREAFPCWDQPEHKIPYQLTLEVPSGLEALSNTPIARSSRAGGADGTDGLRTVVFEPTPPTPSYLLALAVGPFDTVEIPGLSVPGRVVTPEGRGRLAALAVEMTPPILEALEGYFGSSYPYAKLDLIAVPDFWYGGMENPGAITFGDHLLLLDPERVSLAQRRDLATLIAHELAHIWFGDLVTMRWWNDLWLNESFAEWMGDKITDRVYPGFAIDVSSQDGVEWVMSGDARPSSSPIRRAVDSPADVTEDLALAYSKGKGILEMIERWIGEEAFRAGVRRYLEAHAWGNAEAEELWSALSKASGGEVRRSLESFLTQPGYPLITVRSEEADGAALLILEQERFHYAGVEVAPQTWTVPVTLKLGSESGSETMTAVLDRPRLEVALDGRPTWLMPHAGASGYYRWRLPEERLLELAEEADRRLEPVERIAFLGNADALLDAGLLEGDDYLRVLAAVADDPEPLVIRSLLARLVTVRAALVPDELAPAFRRYVQQALGPAVERFGLEPRPGEEEIVSLLRPRLIDWLGAEARDEEVVAFARREAEKFLEDPVAVDPAIAGTVLRVAAQEGSEAFFEELRRRFEATDDPADRLRFLTALGAFETPELRRRALDYTLEGPLRVDELFTIPLGLRRTAEDRDRAVRWTLAHFDALTERVPPMMLDFMPMLGGGCSLERLRVVEEFFGEPPRRTEGVEKNLVKVREQVRDCVALREREGTAVRRYLTAAN